MPEVVSIFVLTGNDDLLVRVAVRDTDHPRSRPGHMSKKVIDPA
ncbi:Lrp/AsnC ligand binding domain-containing protein [Streptomyces olindensis]